MLSRVGRLFGACGAVAASRLPRSSLCGDSDAEADGVPQARPNTYHKLTVINAFNCDLAKVSVFIKQHNASHNGCCWSFTRAKLSGWIASKKEWEKLPEDVQRKEYRVPLEYGGKTGGKTEEGSAWANERFEDWVLEKTREKVVERRGECSEDILDTELTKTSKNRTTKYNDMICSDREALEGELMNLAKECLFRSAEEQKRIDERGAELEKPLALPDKQLVSMQWGNSSIQKLIEKYKLKLKSVNQRSEGNAQIDPDGVQMLDWLAAFDKAKHDLQLRLALFCQFDESPHFYHRWAKKSLTTEHDGGAADGLRSHSETTIAMGSTIRRARPSIGVRVLESVCVYAPTWPHTSFSQKISIWVS